MAPKTPNARRKPQQELNRDGQIDLALNRRAASILPILTPGRLPVIMDAATQVFQFQTKTLAKMNEGMTRHAAARGTTINISDFAHLEDMSQRIVGEHESDRPIRDSDLTPEFMQNRVDMANLHLKGAEVGLKSMEGRHAYYATEEMTALIAAGADKAVEALALTVEDLPSPNGFAYLHRPDNAGLLLWWTVIAGNRVAATLTNVTNFREWMSFESPGELVSWPSPFAWADLTPQGTDESPRQMVRNPFKDRYKDDPDPFRAQDAQLVLPMLFSFVHMIRQEITEGTPEDLPPAPVVDKKGRKRMRSDRVTFLSVRRRPSGAPTGTSGRSYSVRWVVRGHWRRQWYRTQNRHIPIWIMDHIAGPEDAPLVTRDKVTIVKP